MDAINSLSPPPPAPEPIKLPSAAATSAPVVPKEDTTDNSVELALSEDAQKQVNAKPQESLTEQTNRG